MLIITYTSGYKTTIGIQDSPKGDQIKSIDSRFLYTSPKYFRERFITALFNLFGINTLSTKDTLVFAIGGNIDPQRHKVIESTLLNELSAKDLFDNFDFSIAFDGVVQSENIVVFNATDGLAFSITEIEEKKFSPPSLLLHVNHNVETRIIDNRNVLPFDSSLRPIKKLNNKFARSLLCDEGIENILLEQPKNIIDRYTETLIKVIDSIIENGKESNFNFKTIFLFTTRGEFINERQIKEKYKSVSIQIIKDKVETILFESIMHKLNLLRSFVNRKKYQNSNMSTNNSYEFEEENENPYFKSIETSQSFQGLNMTKSFIIVSVCL